MSWEIAFIVGSLIFALVVIVGANVWAVMDTPALGTGRTDNAGGQYTTRNGTRNRPGIG